MAEWVYRAARSRRPFEHIRALAVGYGFIVRSIFTKNLRRVANVRAVAPGDILHFYAPDGSTLEPVGSFRVLDLFEERLPRAPGTAAVTVADVLENEGLLYELEHYEIGMPGDAYKRDPKLGVFVGWRVEPAGVEPPPHRKSLFPGRGSLQPYDRITFDPKIMGGRACIRGMRVTVGAVLELVAAGHSVESILAAYPYLQAEDIPAALRYAAWRAQEQEMPLSA